MPVRLPVWLAAVAAVGLSAAPAGAQQTIVNVPSDNVTPRGQHFYLHESQVLWNKGRGGYNTTNFYTYGLTDRTELAVTQYNVDSGGSRDAALGLGFKTVHPFLRDELPDLETRLTFGHMTPVSVGGQTPAVGFFTYGHLSAQVPGTDLRLLGGVAGGSRNLFGETAASALVGVEYPLTEHLSFTGEWFSGTHNLSGLIPGLTYHNYDLIVVGGVKIPNDFHPAGYGLVLEVGYFFGGPKKRKGDDGDRPSYPDRHYGVRPPGGY